MVHDCTGLVACNVVAWGNALCLVFLASSHSHHLALWSDKRGRVHKSLPGGFTALQVMTHTVLSQGIPWATGYLAAPGGTVWDLRTGWSPRGVVCRPNHVWTKSWHSPLHHLLPCRLGLFRQRLGNGKL